MNLIFFIVFVFLEHALATLIDKAFLTFFIPENIVELFVELCALRTDEGFVLNFLDDY